MGLRIRGNLPLKNSESVQTTEKTLVKIADLLSEEQILAEVDQPLDQAAQAFRLELKEPLSYTSFNQAVGEFVRYVYKSGLRLPRDLSESEAVMEAIYLLTRFYRGGYTEGYEGALLDAMNGQLEGLELVLSRICESIKKIERAKYVNWVFAEHFDRLDWDARRRFVMVYLDKLRDFLPAKMLELSPARLVDHFRDQIIDYVSSTDLLKRVLKVR